MSRSYSETPPGSSGQKLKVRRAHSRGGCVGRPRAGSMKAPERAAVNQPAGHGLRSMLTTRMSQGKASRALTAFNDGSEHHI
jgi:hypothetical protein